MQTQQMLSLVDYLAYMTHCEYVSDLKFMDDARRRHVCRALERIPVETYPLKEWNDALSYVAKRPPQTTSAKARAELMEFLTWHGEKMDRTEPVGRQSEFETNTHQTRRRPLWRSFLHICLSGFGLVPR